MGVTGTQALAGPGSNAYGGPAGAAATPSVAASGPAVQAAGVATTVGQAMPSGGSPIACGDLTGVQTASGAGAPSYTVPTDGVVTAFSHNAGTGTGQVRGVLFRSTAVPANKTIIGKSALVALVPSTLMTFPAQVPVKAGDQLGIQTKVASADVNCVFVGVPGDSHILSGDDPDLTSNFVGGPPINGNRWNISATLEPDVDHDNYGDVSQDQCPQSAATHAACPAPDTKITKKPKKASTQRKVKMKFTSTVPGSTFTCAVDGKAAKPCTSPFKKKFKVGKHKVVITATSPFGPVDATPSVVKFKVTRPA
jgi:hypothetical protein